MYVKIQVIGFETKIRNQVCCLYTINSKNGIIPNVLDVMKRHVV